MTSKSNPGGNKKRASPSDERYQQRRKMGNLSEVNKAKRIARHKKAQQKHVVHLVERAAAGKP